MAPAERDGPSEVDRLLSELSRWAADERTGDAARSRERERWLRQQAAEGARLAGLAIDLAERRAPVSVITTSGRAHQGTIVAVARDFWALSGGRGLTLVAVEAVSHVRPAPGALPPDAHVPASTRTATLDLRLADALAALAAEQPAVVISTGGGEPLTGTLWSVGVDVLTLRTRSVPPEPVYVSLSSVLECSVLDTGLASG